MKTLPRPNRARIAIAPVLWMLALAGCRNIYPPCDSCGRSDPPPTPYPPPDSTDTLIETLRLAYQRKDADKFAALLHPGFQFEYQAQATGHPVHWDAATEIAIHRRMFRPAGIQPPEPPLATELWLSSIDITLTQATRWDSVPGQAGAVHAQFNATLFFETQGDTDYRIEGLQDFVVQIDAAKPRGDPQRNLILHWTDLGAAGPGPGYSWAAVKLLYRAPPRTASPPAKGGS